MYCIPDLYPLSYTSMSLKWKVSNIEIDMRYKTHYKITSMLKKHISNYKYDPHNYVYGICTDYYYLST